MYQAAWRQTAYRFGDLKELMAKATPLRSGDVLAGVAATSAEENVAAKMALADVPLKRFLERAAHPLRGRRSHAPDRRRARRGGLRARLAHDGRRVSRLAAVRCGDDRGAGAARPRPHAGDGRRVMQADAQPGPHPGRAQGRGRHALSQHDRPPGAPGRAPAAEPPDRRQARHRRLDPRRPDATAAATR